ncbi:cation transporter [Streptomyces sp. NBC_00239]|uniref:cation transporter n=1 Tax=Streptomyces sp. NBC_00239 TaxID=2903640 RepID=UPI002E284BB0|nr:cation transporter [Streptomyces sp. NBC_00239]
MKLFGRKKAVSAVAEVDTGSDVCRQVVLLIEGMHCTSCGLLIDDELEDVAGVRSATTDVRTGRCVILLDKDADTRTEALVAAVEAAGDYTARLVA